jgi:hypothetical protein
MNKIRSSTASAVASIALSGALVPLAASPAAATQKQCGRILVPAAAWLAGEGVPVRNNVRGSNGVCHGTSMRNPAVQNGNGWDCYELAARLYYVKNWGRIGTNGGADGIPEGSPDLDYYPNGGGRLPVPGDLIIERYTDHGHVTVVDRVLGTHIYAVEQNATDTGRKTYQLIGSAIDGAYNNGYVRGFMHSPTNTTHGTLRSAAVVRRPRVTGLAGVSTIVGKATVKWNPMATATAVRAVAVQRRVLALDAQSWGRWKTRFVHAGGGGGSVSTKFSSGKTVQLRARATSIVGPGAWIKSAVFVVK